MCKERLNFGHVWQPVYNAGYVMLQWLYQIVRRGEEQLMQLHLHELKTRQSSKAYVALEESMEFMSHIHRHSSSQTRHKRLTAQPIDQRQLLLLIVQVTYLVFASQTQEISLRVSTHIYIRPHSPQYYQPYLLYILEDHFQALGPHQKTLAQDYQLVPSKVSNSQFQNTLLKILDSLIAKIEEYSLLFPQFLAQSYKKPYEQFLNMVNNLIKPSLHSIAEPRRLIQCLQKTQLFIDSSILLKIKSNLFFENIRPFIEQANFFNQLIVLEQTLQNPRPTTAEYCIFLQKILKILAQKKLITFFGSIDDEKSKKNQEGNFEQKKRHFLEQKLKMDQPNQNAKLRHQWQFYTKQSKCILKDINFDSFISCEDSDSFEQQQKIQSDLQKNHFILEWNQYQNLILRLLFDISLSDNFQDSLLLSLGGIDLGLSSIRLSLYRLESAIKVDGVVKIQKKISLSIVLQVHHKSSLIGTILTSLDSLIVHQKIILAELNKTPARNQYFHCFKTVQHQIRVCRHLLVDNIQAFYNSILSPDESDDSSEKS